MTTAVHPDELTVALHHGAVLRITLLDDGLIRLRYARDEFAPRRSWDPAEPDDIFPGVASTTQDHGATTEVILPSCRITIHKDDGRISVMTTQGETFARDLGSVTFEEVQPNFLRDVYPADAAELPEGPARVACRLTKAMPSEEQYYGFGERTGSLEKRGRIFSNWTAEPTSFHHGQMDICYQAHPFFMAVRPGLAWGLFLHTTWFSRFHVGKPNWNELRITALGGELDYYLFLGPDPRGVIEKYTRVTGRPFMPPLWSLGYHQSRWSYMSQHEVCQVAAEFRVRDLPIDVIHCDIDYMDGFRDFTYHPERFPNPKEMVAKLATLQVRPVTIIDPGVKYDLHSGYPVALDGLNKDLFIRQQDGVPFTTTVWPGTCVMPDFVKPETRAWWGAWLGRFIAPGIAGIWNDMNEPAAFHNGKQIPLRLIQGPKDEQATHAETHNLYAYLMNRATYEGLRDARPDQRPWVLTRSGFAGQQRYAASWMGDNNSCWEHLRLSCPQLAGMGISGQPFVGVDIGGFWDNSNPELFARWIQFGAYYPFMRVHTAGGTAEQHPWSYGEDIEAIAAAAMRWRYRLLPYLYSLTYQAHALGTPILRPLFYDFPDDLHGYHVDDQVMCGPAFLIAPVMHPRQQHRQVYLPDGQWYDLHTDERMEGESWHVAAAPADRIPVFIRAGSIIPLGDARPSTWEPLNELTWEIYPGADGAFTLYEDDGISHAFAEGMYAETTVTLRDEGDDLTLRFSPRQGRYRPAPRATACRLHLAGRAIAEVCEDGQILDALVENGCLIISGIDETRETVITVRWG